MDTTVLAPFFQASTLDGVLEFRNEHFWTVSFGRMVSKLKHTCILVSGTSILDREKCLKNTAAIAI